MSQFNHASGLDLDVLKGFGLEGFGFKTDNVSFEELDVAEAAIAEEIAEAKEEIAEILADTEMSDADKVEALEDVVADAADDVQEDIAEEVATESALAETMINMTLFSGIISQESYVFADEDEAGLEGVGTTLKGVWDKIRAFIGKIISAVKQFFVNIYKFAKRLFVRDRVVLKDKEVRFDIPEFKKIFGTTSGPFAADAKLVGDSLSKTLMIIKTSVAKFQDGADKIFTVLDKAEKDGKKNYETVNSLLVDGFDITDASIGVGDGSIEGKNEMVIRLKNITGPNAPKTKSSEIAKAIGMSVGEKVIPVLDSLKRGSSAIGKLEQLLNGFIKAIEAKATKATKTTEGVTKSVAGKIAAKVSKLLTSLSRELGVSKLFIRFMITTVSKISGSQSFKKQKA